MPKAERTTEQHVYESVSEMRPEMLVERLRKHPYNPDVMVAEELSRVYLHEQLYVDPSPQRKADKIERYLRSSVANLQSSKRVHEKASKSTKLATAIKAYPDTWNDVEVQAEDQQKSFSERMYALDRKEASARHIIAMPSAKPEQALVSVQSLLSQHDVDGRAHPDDFAFYIFANISKDKVSSLPEVEKFSQSLEALKAGSTLLMQKHPGLKIVVIEKIFETFPGIGFLRKIVADLAVKDAAEMIRKGSNPLLIMTDDDFSGFVQSSRLTVAPQSSVTVDFGDLEGLKKSEAMIRENPFAAASIPIAEWKERYDCPYIFAARRLIQIARLMEQRRWKTSGNLGASFQVMRPYHYALAGGYRVEKVDGGEDFVLISDIRQGIGHNILRHGRETKQGIELDKMKFFLETVVGELEAIARDPQLVQKIIGSHGDENEQKLLSEAYAEKLHTYAQQLMSYIEDGGEKLQQYLLRLKKIMTVVVRPPTRVDLGGSRFIKALDRGSSVISAYWGAVFPKDYFGGEAGFDKAASTNSDWQLTTKNPEQWNQGDGQAMCEREVSDLFAALLTDYVKFQGAPGHILNNELREQMKQGGVDQEVGAMPRILSRVLDVYLRTLKQWGVDYDVRIPIDVANESKTKATRVYVSHAYLRVRADGVASGRQVIKKVAIETPSGEILFEDQESLEDLRPDTAAVRCAALVQRYLEAGDTAERKQNELNAWYVTTGRVYTNEAAKNMMIASRGMFKSKSAKITDLALLQKNIARRFNN
jgi:hypothetical protein